MKVTGSPADCQVPPMKQPTEPAPRTAILGSSATAAIGLDSLVREPKAYRGLAGLPEHIDRHSATRVPVAADAQPLRLHLGSEALADSHRNVLMEAAMVAVGAEEEL